jgi:hypothetical protein
MHTAVYRPLRGNGRRDSLAPRARSGRHAVIAGVGPGYTWTVDNPNTRDVINAVVRQPQHHRRIDYVFIGSWHEHRSASCQVRSAAVAFDQPIDGVWASDHYGAVVDVKLTADPTEP